MADDDNASRYPASPDDSPKPTPDPSGAETSTEASAEPSVSRVPQKVTRGSSPLIPVTLVIALIAAGLAVWALVSMPEQSSASDTAPSGDTASGNAAAPASPGDAKQRVCDAAQTVAVAVQLQTNSNIGPEPAAVEAVAANARLAMLGGGDYVLSQLDAETPPEVADPARSFGNTLRLLGISALAGVPNSDPVNQERIQEWEKARNTLGQLCTR